MAFIVYICIVVYYFVYVVFCASWKAVLQHYRGRDGATDGTPKKKWQEKVMEQSLDDVIGWENRK